MKNVSKFIFVLCLTAATGGAHPFLGYYEVPLSRDPSRAVTNVRSRYTSVAFECNHEDPEYANEIQLKLPADLVGREHLFTIRRVPGTNQWQGDEVLRAECVVELFQSPFDMKLEKYFNCFLEFKNPAVDLARVESNLRSRSELTEQDITERLLVSQTFQDEHFGFVRYKMQYEDDNDHGRGRGRGRGRGGRD